MNPRHIIILGATSAIAEAVARIYAAEGARVVLAGRNAGHLQQIATDLSARSSPPKSRCWISRNRSMRGRSLPPWLNASAAWTTSSFSMAS